MSPQIDLEPVLEKYSALPVQRLRVVRREQDLNPADLDRAVVFVFALWSSAALEKFRRFTRVLRDLPADAIEMIVLDIEGLTPHGARAMFGDEFRAGGWGETVWFRHGVVVARALGATTPDQTLHDLAQALLA